MARGPKSTSPPKPAELSIEQMKRGISQLQRRIDDLEKFDPVIVSDEEVMALERSIDEMLERVFGKGTSDYDRYHLATSLDDGPLMLGGGPRDTRRYLADGRKKALALLNQAKKGLGERIDDAVTDAVWDREQIKQAPKSSDEVFIVHGHDDGTRETIARFVASLDLRPVILHEQPNKGRTIIEKFEQNSNVGFAIILLTPDDVGGKDATSLSPRARQNVVLELGYFVGKLGRARVCAIVRGSTLELPSDIHGVVWTQYDGNWKLDLARELKAAGYDIDLNKAL